MVNVEAQWHPESKGRKPLYGKEHLLDMILQHASGGYNQTQIAQAMGVHPNTFTKWKNRYPEIEEILTQGRELLIGRVEAALVKRALGYKTVIEKHSVSFYGCEKEGRKPRRVERNYTVEKEVAPDLAAIKTLLTYLGKKLEKSKEEEHEDKIAYFLQGLRETDEDGKGDTDENNQDNKNAEECESERPDTSFDDAQDIRHPVEMGISVSSLSSANAEDKVEMRSSSSREHVERRTEMTIKANNEKRRQKTIPIIPYSAG